MPYINLNGRVAYTEEEILSMYKDKLEKLVNTIYPGTNKDNIDELIEKLGRREDH